MEHIKFLDWDSTFFGIRIGEVLASPALVSADSFDLLYVKSDSDFKLSLNRFTKTYEERKIFFSKKLTFVPQTNNAIQLFLPGSGNEFLYGLAYESGKFSRFFLDKQFGAEKFRKLYRAWTDNSVNGKIADGVLVYMESGRPTAMVTYKKHGAYAQVGIFGVRNDRQGRGIGGQLLRRLESRLAEEGITVLHIPTQEMNVQACAFYKKMGYEIFKTSYIKHYWNHDSVQ